MDVSVDTIEVSLVEQLLAEFNEALRCEGRADFSLLQRCPPAQKRELLALMNVAALAHLALAPEREAFQRRLSTRRVS